MSFLFKHKVNWIYAIGEICLIFIGITLAIAFNNWNENNIQKRQENEILGEIYTTLQNDLQIFQSKFRNVQFIEKQIQTLQQVIESKETVDSLEILCGAVYGIQIFNIQTASYEELKSHGFNLISNDAIRRLIIRVYDTHLKTIEHTNHIENNVVLEALRPYYLQHFTKIRFSRMAVPNHVESIYEDSYYHNLVDYRLTVLRSLMLTDYPQVIADMAELVTRIEEFLDPELIKTR